MTKVVQEINSLSTGIVVLSSNSVKKYLHFIKCAQQNLSCVIFTSCRFMLTVNLFFFLIANLLSNNHFM